MARLPRLMGWGRALEVLLSADDLPGDLAERYGYVNRSLPDSELDGFVDALAMRIASFDKQAIADTKRLVDVASLSPDAEIKPEWDAFVAALGRPASQKRIQALMERGFHRAGDVENRLGFMIRKAKAIWHGTGRAGSGHLSSDSGVLADTPYSFRTRFENEKGTNPEELVAAAHAGCFTMALAFGLQAAGFTPTQLSTEAAVTLDQDGQSFRISRSALTLRAKVPNLDDAAFARIAGEAEKNCPVSKVLNATITLDAKLIP
jgi:lipoyl-dependent peroxiredoxin